MRTGLWLLSNCLALAIPLASCQTPKKDGWGAWRYTNYVVAGIEFRSKCLSNAGADSAWAYQFQSRHDGTVDFVEREERGVEGASRNEWSSPAALTLERGALSPVFETKAHGTCAEVRELKIEVLCVMVPGVYPSAPCFTAADGTPVEFKPAPANPGRR